MRWNLYIYKRYGGFLFMRATSKSPCLHKTLATATIFKTRQRAMNKRRLVNPTKTYYNKMDVK